MKIYLKDHYSAKVIEIDLSKRDFDLTPTDMEHFSGKYAILGEHVVAWFVRNRRHCIWIDGVAYHLNDLTRLSHQQSGKKTILFVGHPDRQYRIEYQPDPPVSTVYYSEDESDADFGLWLNEYLNSPEERDRLLSIWSKEQTF